MPGPGGEAAPGAGARSSCQTPEWFNCDPEHYKPILPGSEKFLSVVDNQRNVQSSCRPRNVERPARRFCLVRILA
jgi:hypothetical protein